MIPGTCDKGIHSGLKWTPFFGPGVRLWFSGSDQPQSDQYHEDQNEENASQCSLPSPAGLLKIRVDNQKADTASM
ncbi:MAG: hypothetical protein ACKPAH_02295, partial [Verrucomicrobiota bacterium]